MSGPPTDYCIITALGLDDLEGRTREYIEAGWAPLGGMQIELPHGTVEAQYHQTMVRRDARTNGRRHAMQQTASPLSPPPDDLVWPDADMLAG